MIQCHLRADCKRHEWYHAACVGKDRIDDTGRFIMLESEEII